MENGLRGEFKREPGVLLDQQHRDARLLVDATLDAKDLLHDGRGHPERGAFGGVRSGGTPCLGA